jgi:ankyrin repeat protein
MGLWAGYKLSRANILVDRQPVRYHEDMSAHLPKLPPKKDNLNGQLLVDPNTNAALCWSLLHEVDPHSTIDGKSLLQVFCENRERGAKIIRTSLDFRKTPLPLGPGQPWPNPSNGNSWGDADMWIAAHLICNGPNPFAWTSLSDKTVLDYAVEWQNPLLMDQLLRFPSGTTVQSQEKKKYGGCDYGWLHGLAGQKGTAAVLDAMLANGWSVDLRDKKGMTALHHAVDGEQVSILLAAGADPLAVDKEGNTARQAWIKQAKALSSAAQENFPIVGTADKFKALDEACLTQDRDKVMEQVIPALFEITAKSKNTHFAEQAIKTYSVPLQDWILEDGNNRWSLVAHMAMEALKKQKSSAVHCVVTLLKDLPRESTHHVSTLNLPDLSLAWLACRHYGANADDSQRRIARLIEALAPEDGTITKVQAWGDIFNAALHLDGNQSLKGKKTDEHIELTWEREISCLQKTIRTYVGTNTPSSRLKFLLDNPETLIGIGAMPFNSRNITQDFCSALILLGQKHPEHAGTCLQVAANLAGAPNQQHELMQTHIKELFEEIMKLAPVWNASLEGAEKRWDGLCALAGSDKQWGKMMAKMQATRLEATTQAATCKRRGPRL